MSSNIHDIAIFPLDLFLLPGETTRLHIFEERYKQLISECEMGYLKGFGIMFKSPVNTMNYGAFVDLEQVLKRYPGGELDIKIKAVSIFALQKFRSQKNGKMYPGGEIINRPLYDQAATDTLILSWREFMVYSGQSEDALLPSDRVSVLQIAITLHLNELEKLELIDLKSPKDRETYIINYLRYLEFLYDQEEQTYHGIYLS